tara:strand:- start:2151 stop:2843 length:693 start_codon:yes stop_codon:yes gene_type:complete
MKLSIVIPCFNEEKNIPLIIDRFQGILNDNQIEIIFVDNGSTDQTSLILKELTEELSNYQFIRLEKNLGYGNGILKGLEVAEGEILAWTHADMQTDPNDVLKGFELFKGKNSKVFVKGSRRGRPVVDLIFTIGMSVFETILLRKYMWDINAQPTMFKREFFCEWKDPPKDFSLDLFAYYQALKYNLDIARFPVVFSKRANGVSKWNIDWISKIKFITRTINYSFKLKKIL